MDHDKAIRAAKLTLCGILEKRRAKTAVERAQGQIAPSKYMPGVPRQAHAYGGRANERSEIWWHGSPSGDLRGGTSGLHLGTKEAALDALRARIGVPADGSMWDGTKSYGSTLLAGKNTLNKMGKYLISGHNANAPDEDYYPHQHPKGMPTVGAGVPVDPNWKPFLRPFKIVGQMTNSPYQPHGDTRANAMMKASLTKGNAKNGYYYTNDAEDSGSISAVVPNGSHVEPVEMDSKPAYASGGYVPMANLPVARLAVAKPSVYSQQPTAMDALSSLASIGKTVKGFSDTISGENVPPQQPHAGRAEPHEGGLTPEAIAAMEALRKGWTGADFGIVSGYRTPEENRAAKGAKDSQHTHGNAYDVDTTGWSPEDKLALADAAWNAGFRGFGFYDNNMHFDVADPRAWGPSHSRDSIPDWAQSWAQQRYGYANGGPVASNDNFQSWFGNSVTHTDGEPHVFYTGTSKDKDFTSFNVGRHGAWFTRDPQVASLYADQNDSQGYKRDGWNMVKTNTASRVIPAYVRAENPYTGELPQEFMRNNYKAAQSDWFDTLRAKGHDAWIPASQGGNLLVALKEPHQIKSIYNSGKFDPKQKHMNKARGGAVEFMRDNHPLVPDELYHGNALKVVENQKYHGNGNWSSELDQEATDRNIAAQDFREFKPSSHGNYGPGIYLTDKPEVASNFAQGIRADQKEPRPHGQVMKLHASIKQPFHDGVLKDPAWKDYIKSALTQYSIPHGEDRDARDAILKALDNDTATVRDLFVRDTPRGTLVNQHGQHDIHDTIRRSGFDGIIAHRPDGSKEYVAFKPEQVKSALSARKFDPTSPDMTYADGGAVTTKTKDGSEIFGNGALIHRYTHPETGGYIDVLQRSNGPASVLGLEVPEEHRGKGIGQMLQAKAMERHPALMGQVSSKAAATTAYRLGRRPYSTPDATLDDVFSAIDRDSSVNMLSPQAQPKARGGAVPQKTVKAYKLFRTKGDGKLYPLFVNAEKPVPMGEWLEAEEGPQGKAQGKVKSKLGDLAYRPGWHAGDLPMATHIGGKSDPSLKKPDYRPDNHVWAEVEMAADKDWQSVADSRGRGVKAHITDQVPLGGFYRYKTNPNMTGNWLIGGNMKVNRVLPDDEVKAINDQAGTADLPRLPRGAFAAGGAAMFEGMHEDLQNEDGTPMDLWHGTPGEGFSEFKDEKLGSTRDHGFYGRGHYLTPDRENAEEYTTNEYEKPGAVMGPLHAALKNPYVWDASEQGSHRTLRDLQSMGIMKGQARLEPWDNLQGHHIRPFMDEMQKRGHDGVVMKTGRGVQEVVVFKPSAIKHRDAERFDPNDPNIYRANGGAIK